MTAFADATNSFSSNVRAFGIGVENLADTFTLDSGGFEGGVSRFGGFVGDLPNEINIDSGLFDSAVTDFNISVEGLVGLTLDCSIPLSAT